LLQLAPPLLLLALLLLLLLLPLPQSLLLPLLVLMKGSATAGEPDKPAGCKQAG
jgi:hypothetical protein